MYRLLTLAVVCSLALIPFGVSGAPIGGSISENEPIQANQSWKLTKTFRGGERACILAIAKQESNATNIEVSVYDNKNELVAADKATGAVAGDFVCVIWYPPRDGEYRVEVHNPGASARKCYIAIK